MNIILAYYEDKMLKMPLNSVGFSVVFEILGVGRRISA